MRKNYQKYPHKHLILVCFVLFALLGCNKEKHWKPGLPLPKEKVKIAVIHPNEIDRHSLYDNAHYEGTLEMQRNIGLEDTQIIRKINVFDGDPAVVEGIIRDCIAEGANIIIAISMGYMDVCEKLAADFPSVIFVHASGYKYNNFNFTNYSTRLYHARYLSGIVAGMKTKTGKIGFVAAMGKDNSEVTGGANAFAIGVHEVNPNARIYMRVTHSWYDPMGETDAANDLVAAGCDVIAAHSNTAMAQIAAQKAGVWAIGFNSDMSAEAPDAVITSVVPRWGVFYTTLVESVISGTFKPVPHFYGLVEGVVDITPINEKLAAPGTEAAVEAARKLITNDNFNVFDGVLETNDDRTVGETGKTLGDEVILGGIDWYYRNIVER
ncbi:MAG: BMP family ABC transporter substrate-binding protein [Treponema sp.]|nr:BMP family ABC transporter substrate-binding protein [Treponema sp.]